jgi:hypothetical protein
MAREALMLTDTYGKKKPYEQSSTCHHTKWIECAVMQFARYIAKYKNLH